MTDDAITQAREFLKNPDPGAVPEGGWRAQLRRVLSAVEQNPMKWPHKPALLFITSNGHTVVQVDADTPWQQPTWLYTQPDQLDFLQASLTKTREHVRAHMGETVLTTASAPVFYFTLDDAYAAITALGLVRDNRLDYDRLRARHTSDIAGLNRLQQAINKADQVEVTNSPWRIDAQPH